MKFSTLSVTPHAWERWENRVLDKPEMLMEGAEPHELLPLMKPVRKGYGSIWTHLIRPGFCYADFEGQILFVMKSTTRVDFSLLTVYTRLCLERAYRRRFGGVMADYLRKV